MFQNPNSQIFVPDDTEMDQALSRTTHLAIGAHQDDLEIMAVDGILHCFRTENAWFTGVVVTNGRSSPRSGIYGSMSDDEMMQTRYHEQKKAAFVGNYGAQVFLGYSSSEIKSADVSNVINDLVRLIHATSPKVIYTHNLADKHATHVAVAVRVVQALKQLPQKNRPEQLYGCEVWRDLDWLVDQNKVIFDCSSHINLQESLLGVFDSQISGGKRYDLATMGRRLANATYFESHDVNTATHLAYAMDLSPLIRDDTVDVADYVSSYIEDFKKGVQNAIGSLIDE